MYYEKSCWVKCLNNANLLIPTHQIKTYEMIKLSELSFRDYSRKLFGWRSPTHEKKLLMLNELN